MAGPGGITTGRVGRESFIVRNIHCARCAGTLEDTVESMPGVVRVRVDPMVGWTSIDFETDSMTSDELRRAVEAGGYEIVTWWG